MKRVERINAVQELKRFQPPALPGVHFIAMI